MAINQKIFREYDIRGVADVDLSDEVLVDLTRAIGMFLRNRGQKTLALGRDCRKSSNRIHAAMVKGMMETGFDVVDIGLVPTPLLYYAVNQLDVDCGVMITGSHNPPEHNGFKICSGKSTIFGEDIQEIKRIMLAKKFGVGSSSIRHADVKKEYITRVTQSIRHPLNMKVVLDSGNGMAGMIAGDLFRALGCEVTELFSELDGAFPNHHPDPTVPENLVDLTNAVKKAGAVAGVAFDGDADRIGVVDRTGKAIFGDELLIIYARDILRASHGATVISEVKASHRLFQDIAARGGKPIMWKTGHSLIKAKMKEEKALLAGEMSGHMFFNDRYFGYDDALYAAARLYEILAQTGKTPCELLSDLPPSFSTPEIRVDCPDEKKFEVVDIARQDLVKQGLNVNTIDGVRVEFPDGWGLVRASNTQPVLVFRFEATSEKRLNEIRELVEGTVKRAIGKN